MESPPMLSQFLAIRLRDIRHLVDTHHMLLIEPLGYLACRELGHPQILYDRLQFAKRHTQ
jgi:hypothetical protein